LFHYLPLSAADAVAYDDDEDDDDDDVDAGLVYDCIAFFGAPHGRI